MGFDRSEVGAYESFDVFWPTFHSGNFPVAHDCAAPACEVISLREWLFCSESIVKGLKEFQEVMEKRIADGITHEREANAVVHVREAKNLLRLAIVLVAEDADAGGVKVNIEGFRDVMPARSGKSYAEYEVYAAHELTWLAGQYGVTLHTHYLAAHPELLPNRHWMVMQALGASFTHLLSAIGDMAVADARKKNI